MLPVGSIVDLCVNKNNVIIPFGFLECNGNEISEDDYLELFFALGGDNEKLCLPKLEPVSLNNDLQIIKIIKACNTDCFDNVGDGEFVLDNF